MEDREARKPGRYPLMLSAVLPGLGQAAQRRWAAAGVFGLGGLFTAGMFFVCAFRIISAYYHMWLDFDTYQVPALPLRAAAAYFIAALLVYAAGLLDTWLAYRRACADWARRKAGLPESPPWMARQSRT
jgi:hypothetical protein